jgi:hypothetical protein
MASGRSGLQARGEPQNSRRGIGADLIVEVGPGRRWQFATPEAQPVPKI